MPRGASPLDLQGHYASAAVSGGGFAAQAACPPGSYCQGGVRLPCPTGRYGGSTRMVNASCTGLCLPGYYCPAGSSRADQQACGGTEVRNQQEREEEHGSSLRTTRGRGTSMSTSH